MERKRDRMIYYLYGKSLSGISTSLLKISRDCNISNRTTDNIIKEFTDKGIIVKVEGNPSKFIVPKECLEWSAYKFISHYK